MPNHLIPHLWLFLCAVMKQTLLNPTINYLKVCHLNGTLPTVGDPSGDHTGRAAANPPQVCYTNLAPCASLALLLPCQASINCNLRWFT